MANLPLIGKLTGTGHGTHTSRVGGFRALVDALPAGVLADEILTPGEGQLRALLVSAGNPLLSCANGPRLAEALRSLELLVSVDMFRNETGNLAHYVLPATSFLERDDVPLGMHGFQPVPYVQYSEAVVAPDGEQRDEWWIFTRLAEAAGVRMFGSRAAHAYLSMSTREQLPAPLARVAFTPTRLFSALVRARGLSLRDLRKQPSGVLVADNREHDFLGKRTRVLRANGKVQLSPPAFVARARELEHVFDEERAQANELKLISKRERTSHNSWMHNVASFVAEPRHTNYLYMHPEDASARGLAEGSDAEVKSKTGRVLARVRMSADLMPGTVALPHGWGHETADGLTVARGTCGVNANVLSADGPAGVEPLSGMVHLTGIPVEVCRATPPGEQAALAEE